MLKWYFIQLLSFTVLLTQCGAWPEYSVEIKNNGPIVRGGVIDFEANLYFTRDLTSGTYAYEWRDNAIPQHSNTEAIDGHTSRWSVEYDRNYPAGPYIVEVSVKKFRYVPIASNRIEFYITEMLNGNLTISQQNVTIQNTFVSNERPVVHSIQLSKPDASFIKNATSITTYWFVDCTYYGPSSGTNFVLNYTAPEKTHTIEALMIADFTPIPVTTTPAPTTTTTTPNSTTTVTPTTTTTTTSTTTKRVVKRSVQSKTSSENEVRNLNNTKEDSKQKIMVNINGSLVPYNGTFPYVCNGTRVVEDSQKTYGVFVRKIEVKEPVENVNVTGNNWLQRGEILTLNVVCQGSQQLKYCIQYEKGLYNVTGNETCPSHIHLDTCSITMQHFFADPIQYTLILIIENDISKVVKPVTVTVYNVKVQPQLSVIVVPVAFCLVAAVLIVFGVAYYLQNRSRFVVEVADFNFGQDYSDMEHMTFRERLKESITNAFMRAPHSDLGESPPIWPPDRKYGSMT